MRRTLTWTLIFLTLGVAAPARADVVTDWNVISFNTIAAAGPVGPHRLIEVAMVHIAMHDAVQAIQHRFEAYSSGMTPASGSVIAAAATAARDVLANRFPNPATVSALDATYRTYLEDHQLSTTDPGVAAGRQAANAIVQSRMGDGGYPVPAPTFFGGTAPGEWRPTVFTTATPPQPASMSTPWLGTMKTFGVMHASQMFSTPPPRLTSRQYTREYNEVKELGRNVGSARSAEQTALAVFYSDSAPIYWNRTLRSLTDRYVSDIGDSARLFALVNIALVDAAITSWQSKIQHNFWRPVTAIQLGDNDGNRSTVGDPAWQPLFATPNYPDHTSGATGLAGAATEMLKLYFGTDRVNFAVVGVNGNRDYTRFSDAANDVIDGRILMGIHFRSADVAGSRSGSRVARWVHKYFLRSRGGDEFEFVRTLGDPFDFDEPVTDDTEGQDDDDAER